MAGQSLPKIQVHNFTTTRSNEAGSSSSNTTPQPVLDATDVAIAANPLSTIGEIQNQTEETIPEGGGIWLDVSESVTEALHMAIQAANDERVGRFLSPTEQIQADNNFSFHLKKGEPTEISY